MIGSKGVPITSVVTEMRFDTNSATPKLTFKPVRFLETNEFNTALGKGKTGDAIKAITMTVAQVDGVDSEVPAQVTAKEETPQVTPEAVEEPTKRASKKEEAPAPKKDLNKILEEWDD